MTRLYVRGSVSIAVLVFSAGCATMQQIPGAVSPTAPGATEQGILPAQGYQDETDKLPRLAPPKSFPMSITGQEGTIISQVVNDGYFRVCERGDLRGCGLFTREVVRRLNPSGDPGGWGWLSKNRGEESADGYAVDAMVWTNNPNDLGNVADIVGGAGAPGARPGFSGFVQRRESNRWVKPVALTAAELAYLGVGGSPNPEPNPNPNPPPPSPSPVDLSGVVAEVRAVNDRLERLSNQLNTSHAEIARQVEAIAGSAQSAAQDAKAAALAIFEVKNWLAQGLQVRISNRLFGSFDGSVRAPQ